MKVILLAPFVLLFALNHHVVNVGAEDMTADSIFSECKAEAGSYCFFLDDVKTKQTELEKVAPSCKSGSGKFCMRVNVKPSDKDCTKYNFEVGAINVEGEDAWLAVGIEQNKGKMGEDGDLLVACRKDKIYHGVDVSGEDPGNFTVKWNPEPVEGTVAFDADKKFMHCSFTTDRVLDIDASALSTGNYKVDLTSGEAFIQMAHGKKTELADNNLIGVNDKMSTPRPSEQHVHYGYSKFDRKCTDVKKNGGSSWTGSSLFVLSSLSFTTLMAIY